MRMICIRLFGNDNFNGLFGNDNFEVYLTTTRIISYRL